MRYLVFSLVLLFSLITVSCRKSKKEKKQEKNELRNDAVSLFPTRLKYAKGFDVINHKNYKEIYVFNPVGTDTLGKYVVALHGVALHDSIKKKGTFIEIPCKAMACLSTTNVGGVELLDLRDKLVGVGSPEYIWDKKLQCRIKEGKIAEVGRGMGFNIEKIVALMPDLLIQNYMDKTDVDGNLSKLGINILYDNSWKEHSLLGRAEWLKFMAIFFCKSQQADSIFNRVEADYESIKREAMKSKTTTKVMYGYDNKGVWYIPQNDTYVAQTLRDANAIFSGAGKGNASTPKSFEEVYEKFHDAEYWLTTKSRVNTMADFLSSNDRYKEFKAFGKNKVYVNNKREKTTGGNDYWESGITRPDLLLKDIVKILHPELYPDYETTYWKHLKE